MTPALKAELENAFQDILSRLGGSFTVKEVVGEFKAQYSELWRQTSEALATDYLREMASRILRRADTATKSDQLLLPGFEGLPKLIRCKGHYIAIQDANLDQLQIFKEWYDSRLAVLLKRTEKFEQTGKEIARLIRLVETHARRTPGITVAEVFQRRERLIAGARKINEALSPEDRKASSERAVLGRKDRER